MPVSAIAAVQVTDDQVIRFGKLIYDRTGIRISPQKKALLSNRLRRRLRATGLESFDEYYNLIRRLKADNEEWDAFLQAITTHETYLFRDPTQWDWLMDCYLPTLQEEARCGDRPRSLRILSAACSTGDEVFTIATCLAAKLSHPSQWKVEIVGTDIGVDAVESARRATFSQRAMSKVPADFKNRFFDKIDDQTWTAKPTLTQWTQFRQHNLMEPLQTAPFDLVFVKNVLIYFDTDSKRKVVANIDNVLRPGGFLASGPAEGIVDLLRTYDRCTPWLHRKPDISNLVETGSKRGRKR